MRVRVRVGVSVGVRVRVRVRVRVSAVIGGSRGPARPRLLAGSSLPV